MSSDHPKQGLFSSLSLGRASRPAKPASSDPPLAHPLLGASTSSLNVNDPSGSVSSSSAADQHSSAPSHSRQNSASGSRTVSTSTDILNVPYKPRQRGSHTAGAGSISSISSTTGIHTATSPSFPPSVTTSPVTPTAAPTTSTSTSTTFALPPSATATTETAFAVDAMVPAVGGSSSTSSASATSRLQLQSLKAAAQKVGLGNGSMGMQLVDTVFEKSQAGRGKAEGVEWVELLKLVSAGKAVLLLPTTPVSSLPITTQILRDHVAFLSTSIPQSASASHVDAASIRSDSAGGSSTTVVTLSGLVGTLRGSTIMFESALSPDSSLFAAIRDPLTRTAALSALRPTTLPSAAQHFPSFTLSTETTLLPFPPINKSTTPIGGLEAKDHPKPTGGKLGRINPFMSLFGGSQAASPALGTSPAADTSPSSPSKPSFGTLSPERPRSPIHAASPSQLLSSPRPASVSTLMTDQAETASIRSDITSRDRDPEGYHILAYTISKPIRAGDIGKSIHKSLKTSIREELHRLPDKVVEKVFKLVVAGACPTYTPSTDDPALTLDYADPTLTGEKLQEVLEGVYDDLILHFRADSSHLFAENSEYSSIRRKASWTRKGIPAEILGDKAENESEAAKKERKEKLRREKEAMVEREATDGTERVEAVVCRLLYNRLFSPLESDDARHDEALSSRIAALNMLDLSLDHLGLITRPDDAPPEEEGLVAKGLADIVDRIGDELQKLSTPNCLTPKEKGDVLIQAHKLVVDGLMDLPPINLRPEGEQYKPPSRSPSPSPGASPAVDQTASDMPKIPSTTSLTDASSNGKDAPPTASSAAMAMRRSSSSASTPLSTSPASNDPLSSIAEVIEQTPQDLQATSPAQVPQLVLPDSNHEASQIEEAMSDSVITLPARDSASSLAEKQPVQVSIRESTPRKQATSGADLILPIIIFAVVKSNPPQLASQLMYLRRYRSAICLTGEASYAIVNLTAVVEFLEHVELSQLGLGDESDKVISVEDLSPIGLNYLDETNADAASIASASSRLRGRVFQVGELAGSAADSANKVLTGVVDSSWTALRGLISAPNPNAPEDDASVPPPSNDSRPGMRPRQASSFSLASVTASVATIAAAAASRSRSRANSRASAIMSQPKEEHTWKGNEEMVEVVSRPASVRERDRQSIHPSDDEDEASDGEDLPATGIANRHERSKSDTRSIYSVASAMSRVKSRDADSIKETSRKDVDREKERDDAKERVSIGDRLASIGVLGRIAGQDTPGESPQGKPAAGFLAGIASTARSASASGTGHARRLSLLSGRPDASPAGSNASLPTVSPASGLVGAVNDIEPPIEQFMTCDVGDIKLSEIGLLLRDYRRLGGIVNGLKKGPAAAATAGAQQDAV